jgi:hypothetical protein
MNTHSALSFVSAARSTVTHARSGIVLGKTKDGDMQLMPHANE